MGPAAAIPASAGFFDSASHELVWGADALFALACISIAIFLVNFMRRYGEPTAARKALWPCAALLICGAMQAIQAWARWHGDDVLAVLTETLAAASFAAAALLLIALVARIVRRQLARTSTAESQVEALQQNLAAALGSIGAGFISTDREGKVTSINLVAQELLQWPPAQALGRHLWEVYRRVDRPIDHARMNPIELLLELRTTIDQAEQVVAIARDGTHLDLEVKAAVTRLSDGSIKGVVVIFRDITAAMRAESQIGFLAAIVESSFDAIIGKTMDGRITSWNAAAQHLFGYSADEAIGQSVTMLIPPESAAEESRIMVEIARGARVAPFTTIRLAKDGRRVEVSLTISPVRDAQRRIIGASKIARDVTAQRQVERALSDSEFKTRQLEAENRQIQEANRAKSLFLANMSHELRTPLNAIIGFADLLHSGMVARGTPQHEEFLGHISTSGTHLLQLINDVLDLSKVESGKFEFFPAAIDPRALVQETIDVLHEAISRKRLHVSVGIDAALTDIVTDPARLKQVLYNYLSNAIKFTPDGGSIGVRASGVGPARFRIEVEDSGIGIGASDVERLFVDFQQLDAGYGKQHQGTGLGLSLTRKLIEAQGGTVGVRSVVGEGSVFWVELGRKHAEARLGRLLLIEPADSGRPTLAPSLSQAGFVVDVVSSAEQASTQTSTISYDAVALTLMPIDGNGLDALARIRSRGKSTAAPVLGVTIPADSRSVVGFAIADVLAKPISTDEVRIALAALHRPSHRRATVMVIDDDPLALELMAGTLAAMEIHSICIRDGRVALRDVETLRPDAIILDLMMPEFDGFSVLAALHGMPGWRHTPVFIWTSMALTRDEYALLASSASAVLGKGGGAVAAMLDAIRNWRPPTPTMIEQDSR